MKTTPAKVGSIDSTVPFSELTLVCLINEKRGTGPTGKRKRGSVIESYTGTSVSALVEAAAEASTVTIEVTMEASAKGS